MPSGPSLSPERLVLVTLLAQVALAAILATMLVRFRWFRRILLTERRAWPERLIFAAGWGANRAATYGVKEEDLGQYYANRTILKREVVPENVADAVYVLTGPELSRTTGLHIPVDSGVAAAFLR